MSAGPPGSEARTGLGPRARTLISAALAGLLVGFLWGVADVPRYSASASVVVSPSAKRKVDPSQVERFAEQARGRQVADVAAGLLGNDVPGADLLADVTVSPDPAVGTIAIAASADSPDFASAAANGYAQALVQVAGKPLELGAAAALPQGPSSNRSAVLWSLIGLAAGLLTGIVAVGLLVRFAGGGASAPDQDRWRATADGGSAPPAPAPLPASPNVAPAPAAPPPRARPPAPDEQAPLTEDAFDANVLASIDEPERLVRLTASGPMLDGPDEPALSDIVVDLGLERDDAPRSIAFASVTSGDGAEAVAAGVAIAAASRLGLRVLLVEADLRHPSLAERFELQPSPGLRDYLLGDAAPREVLRSVRARASGSEPVPVICVPAGRRGAAPAAGIAGPRFDALVERLPRVYDLVVYSAPPVLDDDDTAVIARAADGVVLVCADAEGAGARIARASELLTEASLLAGVLTRP